MTKYIFVVTYYNVRTEQEIINHINIIGDDFLKAWKEVIDKAAVNAEEYEELSSVELVRIINLKLYD